MKLSCNVFGHRYIENKESMGGWDRYVCNRCETKHDEYNKDIWKDTFWRGAAWDAIKYIIGTIGAIAIVVGFIVGISSLVNYNSCMAYKDLDINVIWKFWTGCMGNHPKFGWLPIDEFFRTINVNY